MTIKSTLLTLAFLLTGWVAVLAGVTLLSDDAPAALVLFPSQTLLAHLSEDVALVSVTPFSVTLTSETPDLALQLYQSGAWLVLPAGLEGCGTRL